jgi:hypothetical protein
MRLGLLGPAYKDLDGLARAARFLLADVRVDRAIYLGKDDALEEVAFAWAGALVGGDPSDDAVFDRALEPALDGSPERLDGLLRAERARLRLRALEALPREGLRSMEMFGDRVAVLLYDKALLDEEDIFSATFLIYGKSDEPLVKKIGQRWFLSPGRIGSPGGGSLVLDDEQEEVVATFYDGEGKSQQKETLKVARAAKLRVQGGEPSS